MIKFEQFKPQSPSDSMGPIVFSASNARFLDVFPREDDPWKLWAADIEAKRSGGGTKLFEGILFAEDATTVSIYGVEDEHGFPRGLRADLASMQQAFIQFLRSERAEDLRKIGPLRSVFSGHQYSVELKATAAFATLRASDLHIGVGYRDEDGRYVLLAVEAGDR